MKVSQHDQKSGLLLKTTGLNAFPRHDKRIFTTDCFNDTFLVNTTPMKLYFIFPLEVQNNWIWMISIPMPLKSNMFNMTRIRVVSVAWNMLCIMPEKMLQNRLLPCDSNHLYTVNHMDSIMFTNKIMTYHVRNKGDQRRCYKIVQRKKEGNLIWLMTSETM